MKKQYWWIIVTYILMQLSGIVGLPLLVKTGLYNNRGFTQEEKIQLVTGHWAIISFFIALCIVLFLLRTDIRERHLDTKRASIPAAVGWIFIGFFLALFSQTIAGTIEMRLLGIKPGSENTEHLMEIARTTPWFLIVISIIGPILEEIVFRKILFGTLYKKFNFFIAAIISSLVFAAIHFDFSHLLVYTSMGFVFAFLYVKTRRIIVPIMAHVSMNTMVALIQVVMSNEQIQEMIKEAEKMQGFIGGFLI
ncbi:CPBP family intramembrane metalloprotease [Bacillus pseudomycoides]|uniref:CPBP family intramembrane metalloprotease n=1 Tax=Bacillus pseudomycoides TaxID=64104 RepID=A0AA91V7R4_9BACI|nr:MULTISPECIES: CPBP family intramembrane glutamic endopeptidase [Bacillus]PEB51269.1 CPBP family intramembrane metalloprotease [Bacillus sp. AFS098217]PED80158.1 CPBP family intramembrane metalloprotease [Bacillus pseudomycoides]PEU06892.1 CPBP family intramembrane metalloprotease [Bacillus sp. AFS019443]PEU11434.1 CPBP family intramembrane metalloprotease [Bacillus sp. AFS014408]PFW63378.1 CPBP family intramembrane metalloprotease [Bacillus sp. AFS075034]